MGDSKTPEAPPHLASPRPPKKARWTCFMCGADVEFDARQMPEGWTQVTLVAGAKDASDRSKVWHCCAKKECKKVTVGELYAALS